MSRLVRLYPRRWRDRYEEEFLSLLEERPPTMSDRVDMIRGAVAWLIFGLAWTVVGVLLLARPDPLAPRSRFA